MKTQPIVLGIAVALMAVASAVADLATNPDANTLWIEDFDPFEASTAATELVIGPPVSVQLISTFGGKKRPDTKQDPGMAFPLSSTYAKEV